MFSGIIEEAAKIVQLDKDQENVHITVECSFVNELKIDQSVAHNGVCLTVVKKTPETYTVTAIKETLECSNLGVLKVGDKVNLERSMMMNGRLDGHIVQGHVDQTAVCNRVEEADGSWYAKLLYDHSDQIAAGTGIYDPAEGDPGRGIEPGTPFSELPDNYECPVCFAGKSEFFSCD